VVGLVFAPRSHGRHQLTCCCRYLVARVVLRDQSVIVPQDAAVFELIASSAKAPTPTASAEIMVEPDMVLVDAFYRQTQMASSSGNVLRRLSPFRRLGRMPRHGQRAEADGDFALWRDEHAMLVSSVLT
jgi:hypothetical protein